MNTPVSFPIAKLLKEKGFDKKLEEIFCSVYDIEDMSLMKNVHYEIFLFKAKEYLLHAPTIAEVVMWFYENHGIWIGVNLNFRYQIETKKHGVLHAKNEFNSPTDAYEAAITYALENLI